MEVKAASIVVGSAEVRRVFHRQQLFSRDISDVGVPTENSDV